MNPHLSDMSPHLSDDALLNRLYGVEEPGAHLRGSHLGGSHIESCQECARRWDALRARRAVLLNEAAAQASGAPDPSDRFLAAQRSKIYARLESGPRRRLRWAPAAVAAGALLAVGLFVHRPAAPVPAEPADAQLFADVYSVEQSVEPAAAEPIHALFEEGR